MSPQAQIAESRILETLAAGEFKDLPGMGERLDLEAYYRTPESWRMGMSVLRSADIVPEEVEMFREISRLQGLRDASACPIKRRELGSRIAELEVVCEMKMQRYRQKP